MLLSNLKVCFMKDWIKVLLQALAAAIGAVLGAGS